jgi:tetratricopeptide (TPR) repeat protein
MADKQTNENLASGLPFEERASDAVRRGQEFLRRNQTAAYAVLGLLLAGVALWAVRATMISNAREKARADMGQAYMLLSRNQVDSAVPYLEKVAASNADIETAKAAVILADIELSKGQFDKAEKNYRTARSKSSLPLIEGAALRGLAVCAIDRKDYKTAENLLSQVLSKYQRVTGDPKQRGLGKEPKDQLPFLSQVMLQQAFVRDAQGDAAGARAIAEKLIKFYPESEDAQEAQRFLVVGSAG